MSNQPISEFSLIRLARLAACRGLFFLLAARAVAADASPDGAPAAASAAPAVGPGEAADARRFDILEYRVEGNTTLPRERIEEAVYPFLGEKRDVEDAQKARAALEQAYHDAGYLTVFVNLPEQAVTRGVVRLTVQEGKVDRLRVSGSRYYALGAIKAGASALEEGKVPNFHDVQDELSRLNRDPGRRVTPLLRAGRIPGTVEAELKVDDKLPLHASVELNDRYSRDTSRTRLSAAVRYDNLWQQGHSLNLNAQVAPEAPSESKVLVASYTAPLASGNVLAAYAVLSDTDVTTVGGINSLGKGNILGLRYVVPLRSRLSASHSLTLGADFKDYQDTQRYLGQDNNLPITYMPLSIGYDLSLAGASSTTQFGLSTVFALRGVVGDQADFSAKRTGGKANFAYFKADLREIQKFASGIGLTTRLAAQYSPDPLISNEQMAAGGADTVRGYPESAALGDRGWRIGVELSSPSLAGAWAPFMDDLRLIGFTEAARLDYLDAGAAQQSRFSLASAGLGLRFAAGKRFSGALDYARALRDAGGVLAGDDRIHFRLGAEW